MPCRVAAMWNLYYTTIKYRRQRSDFLWFVSVVEENVVAMLLQMLVVVVCGWGRF